MKHLIGFVGFVTLFSSAIWACPVGTRGLSHQQLKSLKAKLAHSLKKFPKRKIALSPLLIPVLPTGDSPEPWGGASSVQWKPEAVLANALSSGLNEGWRLSDVTEVLASAPVKMIFTNRRVYGDGQANSSLGFGALTQDGKQTAWSAKIPQLVATLVKFKNGDRKVLFRFAEQVAFSELKLVIMTWVSKSGAAPSRQDTTVEVLRNATGFQAEWNVPAEVHFGNLVSSQVVWVQPKGADSAFPIDFRMPIFGTQEILTAAGSAKTAGKTPLDPMDVASRSQSSGQIPELTLLGTSYGNEWIKNDHGGNELRNEAIHGEVIQNGSEVKTAVGGGLTWLVDKGPHSTFKNLYTCFDARNPKGEAQFGVPSGGGWHEIGDAAETIINDMENAPVVVGFATGQPVASPPDGLKFAWGLEDVATIRFLMPGESLMTPAGERTWREDIDFRGPKHDGSRRGTEPSGAGRNYHWFFFSSDKPVCTQEWVHSCLPTLSNQFGLACN